MARIACATTATIVAGVLTSVPAHAISGGSAAADGSYPFTAKIDYGSSRSCTGALIDPEWVVTASTCFAENAQEGFNIPAGPPRQATKVTVGRTNLNQTNGHVVAVVDLVPRPDRNLVLAKLGTPVIDVPLVKLGTRAPTVGDVLRVGGFGRTSTEWVPDRLHTAAFTVQAVANTTLNILGQAPGNASTCKGDSGGPALRESGGVVELVAINNASWQSGCYTETETRQGGTETRLDDLVAWIRQTIPTPDIGCKPAVPLFVSDADFAHGALLRYEHSDPKNGSPSWVSATGQWIDTGWLSARTVAGPDGVLYSARANGELRRAR